MTSPAERSGAWALGFIGLGAMGTPMAKRLLQASYPIGIYNRTTDRTVALADLGARVFGSPAELAENAEVVFTMLADDAAVEQVVLGAGGVIAGARPGATIVDLSSVHPDTSRKMASTAKRRGVDVLDAAVSGSTPQAEDGSLVMFVGGDQAVFERCQPMLEVVSNQIFHVGPNGAGATMKLVVNGILGAGMQALAESIALGQRAGLPRETLLSVLEQTAVLAPGLKRKLQNARTDTYPVQFALRLMWKDFGNVLRLAQQHAVTMPATAAAEQAYAIEQAKQLDEDFSAIIRTMQELAGVTTPDSLRPPTSNGTLPANSQQVTSGARSALTESSAFTDGSATTSTGTQDAARP